MYSNLFGSVTIDLGDTSLNSLDTLNIEYQQIGNMRQSNTVASSNDTIDINLSDTFSFNAPSITSTSLIRAATGEVYNYAFVANDVDAGDTISYEATTLPNWLTFNEASGVLSGTPSSSDSGSHAVVLTATDSTGLISEELFNVAVINGNESSYYRRYEFVICD